jgi:hypothetical protein
VDARGDIGLAQPATEAERTDRTADAECIHVRDGGSAR